MLSRRSCIAGLISLVAAPAAMLRSQWTPRSGTQFIARCQGCRTISWAFEQAAPNTLEFTDGNVCIRAGAAWLNGNDSQTVTGIGMVHFPQKKAA